MSHSPTVVGTRRVVRKKTSSTEALRMEAPGTDVGLYIHRDGREVVLPLDPQQRYVVGRHDAADVVFNDDAVSRVHGVLRVVDDQWVFEDYASSNGSVLVRQGQEQTLVAHQAQSLVVDDELWLGNADSRLRLGPPPPATSSSATTSTEQSAASRAFTSKLELASRTRVPVFLLGASGSGKTHTARRLHHLSQAQGAFVPINCARLPSDPTALHSELLGHVKGAFTGADSARTGKLVMADGGTLFLDEVESLSEQAQGFLLDVLEGTGDLAPLGAKTLKLSPPLFRLVSASKAPLGDSGLRPDLCERLAEGHMYAIPTLQERREDLPALMRVFADEQEKLLGVKLVFDDDAVTTAQAAPWPGQLRQLRGTLSVLAQIAVAEEQVQGRQPHEVHITADALRAHLDERAVAFGQEAAPSLGMRTKVDPRSITASDLKALLDEVDGNQSEAARRLGIARNTLAKKVKDFGL